MRLFDVFLKIIKAFHLVDSEEFAQLKLDVKSWEEDAREGSEDKVKHFYGKMHKGVFTRLLMPIFYFFMLRQVTSIMNPEPQEQGERGLY
ncbi:hypothetical protein [Zunongwangia sp. HRR-M8]|uniref:hypothetical protein n=1 Tax=Zunongwangia sp. HRR-M8 TaxID=3015170 RepID=UPI0022DD1EC2|nr:hypothetical protein [Zunongwangia sp. HRR-M8]WBL20758.1 hypothetical protein PBT89_08425 [Zunongwangia sp. HRR-M8]